MFCFFLISANAAVAETADFENLTLNSQSYWNGSDGSGGFFSGGMAFSNNFNQEWYSWDGFAYSNITNTTAEGSVAQYNAIAGSGVYDSANYAVGYVSSYASNPPTITLSEEQMISGAFFTNNNYAFYSMTNGDDFSKKFTADDWFKLTIIGWNDNGEKTGTVEFKLANGTNIIDTWSWVNLESLGKVKQVTFALTSTDNGEYGMNTPAYFCMDNFNEYNDYDNDDNDSCFIHSIVHEMHLR
jgi:hypothetical protein